jgi:hypothetical protein
LSTPDLLYHHHHVSHHSTLPHNTHYHNQINHASAAATLNRYPNQHSGNLDKQEFNLNESNFYLFLIGGGSHFRFNNYGNDFALENTQLGGDPYEPMLSSSTIHNPNTLDGIIGPSAAATFINGEQKHVFFTETFT